MIQAQWKDKKWTISKERLAPLNNVSTTLTVKKKTDEKTGATTVTGTELQEFTFNFTTALEIGVDPRQEYESWQKLLGAYAPFYLGGARFGPVNIQLQSVALNDFTLDAAGNFRSGTIELRFKEYPEQISTGTMQILYKGKDIFPDISVQSCVHTMYSECQADNVTLKFNDTTRNWDGWNSEAAEDPEAPEETIVITEGIATTGKMFIYDIKPENGAYTLKASSIPPTAKDKTSKSWEGVTFKQLCKEIGERHGLTFEDYYIPDITYKYVCQDNEQDFVFLDKRCKFEGCSFLVFDGVLVVYKEQDQEAETPAQEMVLDTAADFDYSDNSKKAYKTAEVVNASIIGHYSAPDVTSSATLHKDIKTPMENTGQADRWAQNLLRLENKNQKTGIIKKDIQRDLAPGSVIDLKTSGAKTWDGPAFIYKITHDYCELKSEIKVRKPLNY